MNTENRSTPPPAAQLMQLVQGVMISKGLQAVAELGIADHLANGPKSADDLAKATSTHPDALFRLLRALASRNIFRQNELGQFENTPLSEPLRSDLPGSVRDYVIYAVHDGNLSAWMQLQSVVANGKPSFAAANGCDMWTYLEHHPNIGERFNRAMTSLAAGNIPMIVGGYDFAPFKRIIDIGGGEGLLIATLLKAHPHLKGAIFDLGSVAAGANAMLRKERVDNRCEFIAGDAFQSIPAGFDAYLMKNVLHDWSDERCTALLRNCRAAIPQHGKLIILDAVVQPGNDPHPSKILDLHMMVALGGRERTESEFRELLEQTGFTLTLCKPLPGIVGIVEAVPSRIGPSTI